MNKKQLLEAKEAIMQKININPEIAVILGSGLGDFADLLEDAVTILYEDIPHFPTSTVLGHSGELVIGKLKGQKIIAMRGRFHYYEGYEMEQVTFPVRVMKLLGAESLIVTNAAGGINREFIPGDLMLIEDHINNTGTNPLIGSNDENFGPRFTDLTEAYDKFYLKYAKQTANALDIKVQSGVYVANSGPTYETPAEVKMLSILGGDAVGMSTVPEVIIARHMNMRVLGISCISNMAAGILDEQLTHDDVIKTTNSVRSTFLKLLQAILENLPKQEVDQ